MRYREQRGGLADSLKTMVHLPDRAALVAYIADYLRPWNIEVTDDMVAVEKYGDGVDDRIDPPWDTYIVTVKGYGMAGFTDGPA
jgi:hypothetical protein